MKTILLAPLLLLVPLASGQARTCEGLRELSIPLSTVALAQTVPAASRGQ
jgi:hypothetical protein